MKCEPWSINIRVQFIHIIYEYIYICIYIYIVIIIIITTSNIIMMTLRVGLSLTLPPFPPSWKAPCSNACFIHLLQQVSLLEEGWNTAVLSKTPAVENQKQLSRLPHDVCRPATHDSQTSNGVYAMYIWIWYDMLSSHDYQEPAVFKITFDWGHDVFPNQRNLRHVRPLWILGDVSVKPLSGVWLVVFTTKISSSSQPIIPVL